MALLVVNIAGMERILCDIETLSNQYLKKIIFHCFLVLVGVENGFSPTDIILHKMIKGKMAQGLNY